MSDSLQTSNLFNVEGQVVVVTGGGTGIGLMIATALENNGAIVYILGRREEVLQKAAAERNKHGKLIPLVCDVSSRDSLQAAAQKIKNEKGYINVLFNNSGVMLNAIPKAQTEDEDIKAFQLRLWNAGSPEEFDKTFQVNVTALYYTTVAFLELLHEGNQRRASASAPTSQIITVSSIGGYRRDSEVNSVSYAASKAAATHIGKLFANKFKKWHIRSNVIAPGIYPSEMTAPRISSVQKPGPETVPLERFGELEDMGGLALFLVSRAGAYISGGVHITDGGRLGLFSATY